MSDPACPLRPDQRLLVELQSPRYPVPLQTENPLALETFEPLDGQEDSTLLLKTDSFRTSLKAALPLNSPLPALPPSMDFTAIVQIGSAAKKNQINSDKPCRVHAASAFGGQYYSVTLRGAEFKTYRAATWNPGPPPADWPSRAATLGWPIPKPRDAELKKSRLLTLSQIADSIHDALFHDQGPPAKGLVLITGETAAGKTQLINSVIGRYLCNHLRAAKRRPHVVVLGDPIETLLFQGDPPLKLKDIGAALAKQDAQRAFDYTARVLGLDAYSVADALRDALRETPAAYVISELRHKSDFQAALEFAATGHLVFATAHSTTLVDAFAKLGEVFGADNPSQRAALAQRLKAVMHVQPLRLGPDDAPWTAVLPAIWRNSHIASRNFVADGLASLLPRGKSAFSGGGDHGVLGLAHAAAALKDDKDVQDGNRKYQDPALLEGLFAELLRTAHQKDFDVR